MPGGDEELQPGVLGPWQQAGGGTKAQAKNRMEVLERVARTCGALSPEQTNDWKWFKDAWDQNRANAHGPEWGLIFVETMQGVLKDKADGTPNAMSKCMHRETSKHLMGGPMLRV